MTEEYDWQKRRRFARERAASTEWLHRAMIAGAYALEAKAEEGGMLSLSPEELLTHAEAIRIHVAKERTDDVAGGSLPPAGSP